MIFDTAYDPWRLIKVMVNENKGDDPIVNLSWTMDCQRVITITHSVCSNFMYCKSGYLRMGEIYASYAVSLKPSKIPMHVW